DGEVAMSDAPVKTRAHLGVGLHPTPRMLKEAMADVDGVNAKFAVLITRLVGTMWCAYLFTLIALLGLNAALKPGGEGIVAWIAQTFLQLVLLSVIMVGQNVQSIASDKRAECGVFGLYAPGHEVSRLSYFALYALQHRGQESAGIAAADRGGHIITR